MKKNKTPYLFLSIIVLLTITACSNLTASSDEASVESAIETTVTKSAEENTDNIVSEISITSSSLREDGKWLSVITKSKGENKSPQLSWTPVENACSYAIYMFDKSAGNWLHWIASDITETELNLGVEIENSRYVGPYPPSGTHTYEITIIALLSTPDSYPCSYNSANISIDKIINALDISNGEAGNIIGKGTLSGTYTSGEIVE